MQRAKNAELGQFKKETSREAPEMRKQDWASCHSCYHSLWALLNV